MEYIYCFPGIVIEVTPNIKVIRKLVETREKKNKTKQNKKQDLKEIYWKLSNLAGLGF